jgi:hypothetical protein
VPADVAPDPGSLVSDNSAETWRLPSWLLQVLELTVAYLLISQSVHVAKGGVLATSGILLGLLSLTLKAPFGVLRICNPRLHLVLIRVLAAAIACTVVVPASRSDLEGIAIMLFASVALIMLSTRTAVVVGRGRRLKRGRDGAIDATATAVRTGMPPAPSTSVDDDPDTAIRRAGRSTGAVAAAGRRAVDQGRPVVEDQLKKGLRGAGRLAGRLTGTKHPPDDPA